MPGDIWTRYLEPTLSTTKGYAVFPTTPAASAQWLHELDERAGTHGIASYTWPVTGNPIFPPEELERARQMYGNAHPVFREQYLGEWVFYSGTVYGHDFVVERTVIEPFTIPLEWRRIRSIDFGYRDPFVCLWFAIAEASERLGTRLGDLILYREYYHKQRAMAEHAEAIRKLSEGERILYTIADSAEQQSIADLRLLGVPALDAKKDRRAGRMLVGDYFRDGRLKFFKGACRETLRELNHYRWDSDKDKEGAKELTMGDDHAMDALRYAVMSRPQPRKAPWRATKGTFEYEVSERRKLRLLGSL